MLPVDKNCIALQRIYKLHYTILQNNLTQNATKHKNKTLHCIRLHPITLYHIALLCMSLHYARALHYIRLYCVTLHYIALQCIILQYTTSLYPVLPFINHIHKHKHIPVCTAQGGGGSFKDRKPIGEVRCCDAWMAEQSH